MLKMFATWMRFRCHYAHILAKRIVNLLGVLWLLASIEPRHMKLWLVAI